MSKIRIVAFVVDTNRLTLYKEDGETVLIDQGDARVRRIVDEATPLVSRGLVAEIDLTKENHYQNFEKKSSGLVRFFRVTKKTVSNIFSGDTENKEPVEPMSVGLPVVPASIADEPTQQKIKSAVDEVLANATPSIDPKFNERSMTSDETIIAVVDDKIIPGVETLERQFENAYKLGSQIGVERFLQRIAAVIGQRSHSIEDLLRFMERGDLPIADDGSIIIYKLLNKKQDGLYVDIHSGGVQQKVGSYVCMDPKMVDRNRSNECSNGLHVARRGYLGSFGGNVCVLAKLNPEDVIAVPNYDANKMRVCGYHILFELPDEATNKLRRNQPMTDNPMASKLLGRALRGDHTSPTQRVQINGQRGTNVVITSLVKTVSTHEGPVEGAKALDDKAVVTADPSKVSKDLTAQRKAEKPQQEPKKEEPAVAPVAPDKPLVDESLPRNQKAVALWDIAASGSFHSDRIRAANELLALKKKSKVGWSKLGLDDNTEKFLKDLIEKNQKTETKVIGDPNKALVEAAKETEKLNEPVAVKSTGGSRAVIARRHFELAIKGDKASWSHLWLHKKQAKVSWQKLGFDSTEIKRIETNKPDHV